MCLTLYKKRFQCSYFILFCSNFFINKKNKTGGLFIFLFSYIQIRTIFIPLRLNILIFIFYFFFLEFLTFKWNHLFINIVNTVKPGFFDQQYKIDQANNDNLLLTSGPYNVIVKPTYFVFTFRRLKNSRSPIKWFKI